MQVELIDHHREHTTHAYAGTGEGGVGSITECGVELPHSPFLGQLEYITCKNCKRIIIAKMRGLIDDQEEDG